MTLKITQDDGTEIEVYTAAEVTAARTAERTTVEGEYKPKLTASEAETKRLDELLKSRGEEFKQFRKLNDEQYQKLTVAEKTIYDNGILLQEAKEKDEKRNKEIRDGLIVNAIKAKVGTDEKLFTKVKDMFGLIGIEANTAEEIDRKVLATLGAIGQMEPDALASVAGFTGGSFEPPKKKDETTSFADTERGKKGLDELGFKIPEKK